MAKYVIGIDQGTTSCRSIVFDCRGQSVGIAQQEFTQYCGANGWVEHDPLEILAVLIDCIKQSISNAGIKASEIACVGITNQRDTSLIWDKNTGKPARHAITWQCRPSADHADLSQHAETFWKKRTIQCLSNRHLQY